MSVYKRRGRWFCDTTIDGRRVQRVLKKAHTRVQAIEATTVIENKVFENRYQIERRPEIRFDKFVKDHFLPYSKLHKRTYPDDVKICEMLNETFGRMMLSEINPPLIEKWKQKRREGKTMYKRLRNPATVNREMCVLSKIFSLAFDAELIDSNPCRRVRKFRTNSGMRQGEIFDLTWFDMDLPRGVIHIRVSKNGKDRFVPINQTVRAMLEGLPHANEHVFPSPKTKGRVIDVKRRFDLAKSDAGIKDFRFHDLRHTAATRMADCGADAFTLAAIFGWSDVRMALRYTHATDEAKRRAVENLVRPVGPSDESVTNEKGKVAALP